MLAPCCHINRETLSISNIVNVVRIVASVINVRCKNGATTISIATLNITLCVMTSHSNTQEKYLAE